MSSGVTIQQQSTATVPPLSAIQRGFSTLNERHPHVTIKSSSVADGPGRTRESVMRTGPAAPASR